MILVTGATGFVGRDLVWELLKKSRKVRCFVRDPSRAKALEKAGCQLAKGVISDKDSILHALTPEIDSVINLVGILHETKGASFRDIHVHGLDNIVKACLEKGIKRIVHISALGARQGAPSEYHRSKWQGEELIKASGLDYTIFRPSVIFGREDNFTNLFAGLMRFSPVIAIPGNGENRMQPVYVGDAAKALAMSFDTKDSIGQVYEIAGKDVLTFNGIIDEIAAAMGKKRIKIHVPFSLMRPAARLAESLPMKRPFITRDQLLMLQEDNVTADNALLKVFGIEPACFKEVIRKYLG